MDIFLFVFSFLLLGLAVAVPRVKRPSSSSVNPIRGSTTAFAVPMILALTLSGGLTIGVAEKAYSIGFPSFWFIAMMAFALAIQAVFLQRKIKSTAATSIPMLADRVGGKSSQRLAGVLIVATWIGLIAAQFSAAGMIVSTLTGLAQPWATIVSASFLIFFTLVRGPKPISSKSSAGFVLLVLSLVVGAFWLFVRHPLRSGTINIHFFTDTFRPIDLLYYLLVVAGANLVNPMLFDEIGNPLGKPRRIRHALLASALIVILFAFVVGSFGIWASASKFNLGMEDPLNSLIGHVFPAWLGATILFALLSTIISTTAKTLWSCSYTFDHDVLRGDTPFRTHAWIGVAAFPAMLIAIASDNIVGLLLATYQNFSAGVAPAVLIALIVGGKRQIRPYFFFTSMAAGYLISFIGNFMSPSLQRSMAFAGIAVSTLICAAGIRRSAA
jgi:SSS family solute:Na+ symporter